MAWIVPEGGTLTQDMAWPPYEAPLKNEVPYSAWTINGLNNSGYPYCELMIGIPKLRLKIVDQNPYICVYDIETHRDGFNNNGLAILCPSECTVHEVLNGEYYVRMRHPMDVDGKWKFLLERNYLKVLDQIFTIMKVDIDYDAHMVDVYAEHVFYQLADAWIYPVDGGKIAGTTGSEVLQDILIKADYRFEAGQYYFQFESFSDIDSIGPPFSKPLSDGFTPVEAILGSGGLCEATGGELLRDNFYFSVCKPMEDSAQGAFDLRVGNNLHGIKRIVDTSTMCTHFTAYDNYGSAFAVSWSGPLVRQFPHNIVRSQSFSFPEFDWDALVRECYAYFGSHCQPIISYTFDIEDGRGNPTFDDIETMYRYQVGDTGQIFDNRLSDTPITLKITETEKDRITGKCKKLIVGNRRSFTRSGGQPAQIAGEIETTVSRFWIHDKNGIGLVDKNGRYLYQNVGGV
jgi:phage-related protein